MTDRWDDERLDRLAELVEANSRSIAASNERAIASDASFDERMRRLDEKIVAIGVKTDANAAAISQLTAIASDQQQTIGAISQGFELLVQEIRGLRAENRRILEHLFGTDA